MYDDTAFAVAGLEVVYFYAKEQAENGVGAFVDQGVDKPVGFFPENDCTGEHGTNDDGQGVAWHKRATVPAVAENFKAPREDKIDNGCGGEPANDKHGHRV